MIHLRFGRLLFFAALGWCACAGPLGCGGEPTLSGTSAALIVPMALADDLATVVISLFQIEKLTYEPKCEQLDASFASYADGAFLQAAPLNFKQGDSTVIDGIPDRGEVWRFYARGFDGGSNLIATGCFPTAPGGMRIEVGSDTTITIELLAVP
jgi:hypothetical protein